MKNICDPEIIPAVIPNTASELSLRVAEFAQFAHLVQVDIVDGKFAQKATWPLAQNDAVTLPNIPCVQYEIHLMMENPQELGVQFARAGAKRIIGHVESFEDFQSASSALAQWHEAGAEAGLALRLDTPLSAIPESLANQCDCIQLMSIANIGAQGEPFDEHVLTRVEELHAMYPEMMLAVDGGVSEATVEQLVRAGAQRFVVGRALISDENPATAYARILGRAQMGCAPILSNVAAQDTI